MLGAVAASLGSSDALTAGRPGSWEASLVDRLVKGTVGWDDEHLADYAQAGETAADPAAPGLDAGQLETLTLALADAADYRESRAGGWPTSAARAVTATRTRTLSGRGA